MKSEKDREYCKTSKPNFNLADLKKNKYGEDVIEIRANGKRFRSKHVVRENGDTRFANEFGPGVEYDVPTDGLFQVKFSDGKLRYEWYYKDGKQDGISKGWWSNGNLKQTMFRKDGKMDGKWIYWYENGQKRIEENYKDGGKTGLVTIWFENGQKREEGYLKNGIKDGLYTEWYENGQKKNETNYKDGKVISEKRWDEDGM